MYDYTPIQWLFFFYAYCFLGWCVESAYVSIKDRVLTNRGFMRGPFLPLYGSGALTLLMVSNPFGGNIILTFIASCIGATILELITGIAMEAIFKVRYWDYTNQPLNYRGYICMGTTLSWGFLGVLLTKYAHPFVQGLLFLIPLSVLRPILFVLTALIGADFGLSFKAALDLRTVLIKMEEAKQGLITIQRRLEIMNTFYTEGLKEGAQGVVESVSTRADDMKKSIEARFENIANMAKKYPAKYTESMRAEYNELKEKYGHYLYERMHLSTITDFFQRSLIRDNPDMTSERFKEALEELKSSVLKRK
ncbi:MAG: hypothetical protein IJ608_12235 [Lachnospiraceae bacterium]|nr:hypothetical protein [Lachnospiraceae bacterium]